MKTLKNRTATKQKWTNSRLPISD